MSRFKIVIFLMAVGIAGSTIAAAYWYYTRVMGHDSKVQREIKQLQAQKSALPDPGVRRFDKAIEQLNANDVEGSRAALYELVKTFPDSSRTPEAKRIIGEMNMDMLFSREDNPARKEHIVQPGQGLLVIASKNHTTVECLLRANSLQSTMLQPGDKVTVFPLEFEIVIDVSEKKLNLMRKRVFFKQYDAVDLKVPPGMRIPAELKIGAKSAVYGGKQVKSDSPEFVEADKWLSADKGTTTGVSFLIRSLPRAKPAQGAANPGGETSGAKGQGHHSGRKQSGKKSGQPAAEELPLPEPALTGIFLPREDVEELYTILRQQTPVTVIR